MTWTKLPLKSFKLAFAISFASLGFMPVKAQPVNPVIPVHLPTSNPIENKLLESVGLDVAIAVNTLSGILVVRKVRRLVEVQGNIFGQKADYLCKS